MKSINTTGRETKILLRSYTNRSDHSLNENLVKLVSKERADDCINSAFIYEEDECPPVIFSYFIGNYLNPFKNAAEKNEKPTKNKPFHDHFRDYLNKLNYNESAYSNTQPSTNCSSVMSQITTQNLVTQELQNKGRNKFKDIPELLSKCQNLAKYINSVRGSKALKKLIILDSKENISLLFKQIKPQFNTIVTNCFGNYFCQELFKLLNRQQRSELWQAFNLKLKFYICNEFSNYCIQTLLELTTDIDEQLYIIKLIFPTLSLLVFESYSNRILLKIMNFFENSSLQHMSEFLIQNLSSLSLDAQGVCIINKYIFRLGSMTKDDRLRLVLNLRVILPNIINHVFAHYALLTILEEWNADDAKFLVDYCKRFFVYCAYNKYANRILRKLVFDKKLVSLYC